MNFAFLALACFPKKTKSKAELHTSSNPTLANSTREWGTFYMEVAYKRPKREGPGHPPSGPQVFTSVPMFSDWATHPLALLRHKSRQKLQRRLNALEPPSIKHRG